MAKQQKIEKGGIDGNRYFWNVKGADGRSSVYRSRCTSASAVKAVFAKSNKKVLSVTALKV